MKNSGKLIGALIGTQLLFAFTKNPLIAYAQKTTAAEFSIHLTPENQTVTLGHEVRVHIILKNVSDHEIVVPMSPDSQLAWAHYDIHLLKVDGVSVPETPYGRNAKGNRYTGSIIPMPVRPGETLQMDAVLSKLFDISVPGDYHVVVDRSRTIEGDGTRVNSDTATITIVP